MSDLKVGDSVELLPRGYVGEIKAIRANGVAVYGGGPGAGGEAPLSQLRKVSKLLLEILWTVNNLSDDDRRTIKSLLGRLR